MIVYIITCASAIIYSPKEEKLVNQISFEKHASDLPPRISAGMIEISYKDGVAMYLPSAMCSVTALEKK